MVGCYNLAYFDVVQRVVEHVSHENKLEWMYVAFVFFFHCPWLPLDYTALMFNMFVLELILELKAFS